MIKRIAFVESRGAREWREVNFIAESTKSDWDRAIRDCTLAFQREGDGSLESYVREVL